MDQQGENLHVQRCAAVDGISQHLENDALRNQETKETKEAQLSLYQSDPHFREAQDDDA